MNSKRRAERPLVNAVRAVLFCLLFFSRPVGAFDLSPEPDPFRGDDQVPGRDFTYNDVSFLQRLSFRFRPSAASGWNAARQGLRGSAGSTRSDEFYYVAELRKRWDFEEAVFIEFRHRTDEDFDGRYHRSIPGIGLQLGDAFTASLLASLEGNKENIDVYLELEWAPTPLKRIRLAGVAVDATFNQKSEAAEYKEDPLTLFGEVYWHEDEETGWEVWTNVNPDLSLAISGETVFEYTQWDAGARYATRIAQDWLLSVTGTAGGGDRCWETLTDTDAQRATLEREHGRVTALVSYRASETLCWQFGYHYFHLEEDATLTDEEEWRGMLSRDEHYAYGGIEWQLSRRILFWPGAYLGTADIFTDMDPEEVEDLNKFQGKLGFPFEISFAKDATLTLDPSLRIDELRFGGMNLQVQMPF